MWTDRPGTASGGFDPTVPLTYLLMQSPDGTVWTMTVDNAGAWVGFGSQVLLTEDGDALLTEAGQPLLMEV